MCVWCELCVGISAWVAYVKVNIHTPAYTIYACNMRECVLQRILNSWHANGIPLLERGFIMAQL